MLDVLRILCQLKYVGIMAVLVAFSTACASCNVKFAAVRACGLAGVCSTQTTRLPCRIGNACRHFFYFSAVSTKLLLHSVAAFC